MAGVLLSTEPSIAFICFFGVAVVFAGLVILIGLIYLMNYICDKLFGNKAEEKTEVAPVAPASVAPKAQEIANRGELVAAVCAAVAEEEGTDISAIRVISFKKI